MKKTRIEVSLVLVGLTVLALLVTAAVPAGAQIPANVSIGDITLAQGATATIPIMINEAPNKIASAEIKLTYNPTVVQVTAVGNSPFDDFQSNIVNGEVKMLGSQWWSPSLTAPTKFADVTVKAIGSPGDCTPLNLEGMVYMGTGSPYHEVEMNNGSVCIVAAVPAYNTFGMIALIGLLAIILAVKVKRR